MSLQGLSQNEAQRRLQKNGPNELPSAKGRSFLNHLTEVIREPMSSLLAACGLIYALIGDRQEALMLLGFWALILFITLYQERKTESALAALRRLSSPLALVIRDGTKLRVPAIDLVIDDIIQMSEGDIVPADAILIQAFDVHVDESLLTGESFPVNKEVSSHVWSATTLTRGNAIAKVTATGARTRVGEIGILLSSEKAAETPLKVETRTVVRHLTVVAIILCVLTSAAYAYLSESLLAGVLVGLTLAMAILPNELPAVLTIFLSLGTRKISQRNVLTRKLEAVENIGATTTLCVDKTGTLTLNQMRVQDVVSDVGVEKAEIVKVAALASNANSFDPMERALFEIAEIKNFESPVFQFPRTAQFFAISNVYQDSKSETWQVNSKGAPEFVLQICSLSQLRKDQILKQVDILAQRGLRVLAVAKGKCHANSIPKEQEQLSLDYLGLIGFADPVRPGVKESIDLCYQAGIRVIMITGDHSKTASSIAHQIGLKNYQQVLTGHDMEKKSDKELVEDLKYVNCFARMVPEQKLRIVKLLQGAGEVVAMTGDGVNDAPALLAAQIGIAMGRKGTDVARESASMVLLDDDFSSIVQGIKMGRRIYTNLQAAMAYLLAVHVPIAGISMLPVFLELPLVLMPIHIAFLHLIIEPACSLVFESDSPTNDIMKKPPRGRGERFFSKKVVLPSLYQGLVVYGTILIVFIVTLFRGQGEADARTLTFTTLMIANLGLIITNHSWTRSQPAEFKAIGRELWIVVLISVFTLGLVLYVPMLRQMFRFSVLHPLDIAISLCAGISSIAWFIVWKFLRKSK